MRKIAPSSRTRVVISIAIGLVACVVQAIFTWNTPSGDEPAKINDANALLEQFRRSQQTDGALYTVQAPDGREIKVFAHTIPTQSRLAEIFQSVPNEAGHKILVQIPEYNTTDEFPPDTKLPDIRDALRKKFPPEKVGVNRSWKDVEAASRELTRSNGLILKAKAMQYLAANPDSSSESSAWNNRFELALRSLSVCTTAERIRRTVGLGLVVFVISTPLTWLVLRIFA
jgi:hypothetical protein